MSRMISEGREKVFCIGFQKNGTSTMARALTLLGYSVTGPNFVSDFLSRDDLLDKSITLSRQHDGFQDNPWPILFREMDELYPSARFLLTRRDTDKWLRSMEKQFSGTTTPMRELIYGHGCPAQHRETYRRIYEDHNHSVLEHFADRPGKLLVLDLDDGFGWEEICAFLDRSPPRKSFPRENVTWLRPYNKMKRAIRRTLKGA